MKSGLVVNLVCIAVLSVVMETIGILIFPIDSVLLKVPLSFQDNVAISANITATLPAL